jgi:Protein of unknown function (DUF3237)
MVQLAHDGLELWYGTPDAPAPDGTTEQRRGVSVTVGVRPANPANVVCVRYRIDWGAVGVVSAPLVATDFRERTQYFRATFPTFWSGKTVEYLPVVSCDGRRAPDPATAGTFPSSFRLSTAGATSPLREAPPRASEPPVAFPARLEHLAHVRVVLAREPELIGVTPVGFVVNWAPLSGTVDGPDLHATVVPGGEHQTVVRADGIGVLSVSVTIQTHDRALIAVTYSGTVDYGEDWAARLPLGNWPDVLPVRSHSRLLTSDPRYRWLNRLACLGVGEVRPPEYLYSYDMYAVR